MAIALFSSTDQGATWKVVNIVATGGWQGGSAGAIGDVAAANTNKEVDPVWEPYLMVYNGQLVCFYSDDDYTGFDPTTGAPTLDPPTTPPPTRSARFSPTGPGIGSARMERSGA